MFPVLLLRRGRRPISRGDKLEGTPLALRDLTDKVCSKVLATRRIRVAVKRLDLLEDA